MSVLLQRELVLNRHKALIATRLRVHADSSAAAAQELNRLMPLWPQNSTVMLGLTGCATDVALMAWVPPPNSVLEIPATQLGSPEMRALRIELAIRKAALCLNGEAPPSEPIANFRFLLTATPTPLQLETQSNRLLAPCLSDGTAFEAACAAGYAGASGWFCLHPVRTPGKQLNPSHAKIIHLLNLVRNNAEINEIESSFKQDVSLAFKLLRYINSAGFGLRTEVGSFRQAVTLMGYDKLNRWLSLLLASAGTDAAAPALMHTALMRARLMELMGTPSLGKEQGDNLFITGAFSVLEVLLGTQLDTLLQHMQLPTPISAALLNNSGEIAPFLQLALACEAASESELRRQLAELGVTAEQCNSAQMEALLFAEKLQLD